MNDFRKRFDHIISQCKTSEFHAHIKELQSTFSKRDLVLYGAGELGIRTENWLSQHGIQASCFCDRSLAGGKMGSEHPIIHPQELKTSFKQSNIIICSIAHSKSIKNDLEQLGINPKQIFYIEQLQIHELTIKDFQPHVEGYEWAYHFFKDPISKEIILKRIEGYLLSSTLESSKNHMYFDEEILNLSTEEVFVDGGMFTGDTMLDFVGLVNQRYRHYYGFEIESKNYNKALMNLKGFKNVTLTKKGLWSHEAELRFQGNLSASSKLSKAGDESALVTNLDLFFNSEDKRPTLIKLDIEGAEKEALVGAKNIIQQNKPKLAICAYHKPEDVYDLPELLTEYNAEYDFSLRHYSTTLLDTVLYAV